MSGPGWALTVTKEEVSSACTMGITYVLYIMYYVHNMYNMIYIFWAAGRRPLYYFYFDRKCPERP